MTVLPITVEFHEAENWLYCDWKGIQTNESIKEDCEEMLKALKSKNCYRVLNDDIHVKGTWTYAADWLADNWFPRIVRAGLRDFAFVYSPDVFSKFSTDTLIKRSEEFNSGTFKSVPEAAT